VNTRVSANGPPMGLWAPEGFAAQVAVASMNLQSRHRKGASTQIIFKPSSAKWSNTRNNLIKVILKLLGGKEIAARG